MEQTATLTNCPHCQKKLSDGMFNSNSLVTEKQTALINEFTAHKADAHCNACWFMPHELAKQELNKERRLLQGQLSPLLNSVLAVSIQSPYNWEYEVMGLVTGQTTTGTGIFSEIASSFTDFFGSQSGAYNEKISEGEQMCLTQLRLKCLALGGNAIVGTDIDYAEVGGGKGMLMVCMTGTAVKLKNPAVLGTERLEHLKEIQQITERLTYLNTTY